jgi:predicted nucleotidyltransferase
MISDNKTILNDLNTLLKSRFHDNLKDLVLFGSRVNGTENNNSDFDVLIVLKKTPDWKTEREISDLCYEIDLKYNIITDTHVLSEIELTTLKGKQPVFINALSNGIHA